MPVKKIVFYVRVARSDVFCYLPGSHGRILRAIRVTGRVQFMSVCLSVCLVVCHVIVHLNRFIIPANVTSIFK